jgi:hypothetical protein
MVVTAPSYHYWAQHAKYESGRFYETVHPDHYAWYSPSTLGRLLRQVLSPTDEVELFFVNGQSMVGARVTRPVDLARHTAPVVVGSAAQSDAQTDVGDGPEDALRDI